mmetsp:Transcript_2387/g.4467  ORF Transcript_2387/g.4467 Transcript_2387/m.4467 type:complete len:420 (+) Transcript_2387:204-1463(+)
MILLFIIKIFLLTLVLAKRLIQRTNQQLLLPNRHLIQHGRKVHGQPITQHTLHEHSNHLNMHPGNKRLSVMGFAPSCQSGTHVVDFYLELFEFHRRFSALAGVKGEVLADNVAFFAEGLGEALEEVDLGALDEFFAFVVSGLVHTPQNRDSVQNTIIILHDLLQRSRNDGRALLSVSIDLRTKVLGFSEPTGVVGPVRPTIPDQLPTHIINLLLKALPLRLPARHKHRLQIFRIMNLQPPNNLLIQHIIQIHTQQIPALPPLGVLQRHLLLPITVRQLLQLLVNRRDSPRHERDQLLERTAVGELGVIPRELLYVSRGGDSADGELGGFFSGEFDGALFDLSDDAFDEGVGFAEVVAEVHEGVEGADHEGGDFEFEHFPIRCGGAGGGILELAVGGFGGLAGVGDGRDEVGWVGHGGSL